MCFERVNCNVLLLLFFFFNCSIFFYVCFQQLCFYISIYHLRYSFLQISFLHLTFAVFIKNFFNYFFSFINSNDFIVRSSFDRIYQIITVAFAISFVVKNSMNEKFIFTQKLHFIFDCRSI